MLSRRAFIVSAGLAVSSLLAGCKKDDDEGGNSTANSESDDGTDLPDDEYDTAIKSGRLSWTITDCRIADASLDNAKALVVHYEFKNRSGKEAVDIFGSRVRTYQNGRRLGYVGVIDEDQPYERSGGAIESGASVPGYISFQLDDSSPVTIKLLGKILAKVSPDDLKPNS